MIYARYKVMVLMEVTTEKAEAYRQMNTTTTLAARIAQTGVPNRGLTRFIIPAPGIPSSRANAYQVRAMDVRPEQPQSHIARPMTTATKLAKNLVRLWSTM